MKGREDLVFISFLIFALILKVPPQKTVTHSRPAANPFSQLSSSRFFASRERSITCGCSATWFTRALRGARNWSC